MTAQKSINVKMTIFFKQKQEEQLEAEVNDALELEDDLYSEDILNEFLKKRMESLLKSQTQV